MSESLTFGQLMLSKILPPGFYKPGDVLDKNGIKKLMQRVANEMPEQYEDISHKLVKLGLRSGEAMGGASFGLDDMGTPPEVVAAQERVKNRISLVLRTMPRGPERKAKIAKIIEDSAVEIPKIVLAAAEASNNQFAKQLKGAGRGNVKTLTSMMAGPLIAYNSSGEIIPIPLLRGYNRGQSFSQYLASAYGARRDINTTKLSVGSSGYLSKLLQQSAHRSVVVGRGDEDVNAPTDVGVYTDLDDVDNVGSVLGRDYGPYKRNTVITPKVLAGLEKYAKDGKVLLRSPIASASLDDGVYALDVGVRENGRLPMRGEHVGLPAGQAIGEKVTQTSLGAKHGASGVKVKKTPGLDGFALSDRLVNPPHEGAGLAIHARADGRIESIREAPQGGKFFKISGDDEEQYVPQEFTLGVKVGDTVEAGDALTDGIPDPAEIARFKGLGAARLAFVNSMRRGLSEAGFSVDRRNIELLAHGLYNRVEFDDEHEGVLPGTIKSYSRVAAGWKPRIGHVVTRPAEAVGNYLERPVLHHSIGTRITPSVRKELESAGITAVTSHKDRLPFSPKVVRASDLLQTDDDFMTRFLGSSLEKSLLDSIHQSGESDESSTSFVPVRAGAVGLKSSLFSGT